MTCSVHRRFELFEMTFDVFERDAATITHGIYLLLWPPADSEHVATIPNPSSNRSQMKYNTLLQNHPNTMSLAVQEHTQRLAPA